MLNFVKRWLSAITHQHSWATIAISSGRTMLLIECKLCKKREIRTNSDEVWGWHYLNQPEGSGVPPALPAPEPSSTSLGALAAHLGSGNALSQMLGQAENPQAQPGLQYGTPPTLSASDLLKVSESD